MSKNVSGKDWLNPLYRTSRASSRGGHVVFVFGFDFFLFFHSAIHTRLQEKKRRREEKTTHAQPQRRSQIYKENIRASRARRIMMTVFTDTNACRVGLFQTENCLPSSSSNEHYRYRMLKITTSSINTSQLLIFSLGNLYLGVNRSRANTKRTRNAIF